MFVFDWLFGHRKKESFWERSQESNNVSTTSRPTMSIATAVTVITITMIMPNRISMTISIRACSTMTSNPKVFSMPSYL